MSSENVVIPFQIYFGAAGTQSSVPSTGGTATSQPYRLSRSDYTIQLSAVTTGTSVSACTCVWEASNDNLNWTAMGTASATAAGTAADTTAFRAAASFAVSAQRYAYGRARPIVTGTGAAQVWMGS